jgi:hypothetical protein
MGTSKHLCMASEGTVVSAAHMLRTPLPIPAEVYKQPLKGAVPLCCHNYTFNSHRLHLAHPQQGMVSQHIHNRCMASQVHLPYSWSASKKSRSSSSVQLRDCCRCLPAAHHSMHATQAEPAYGQGASTLNFTCKCRKAATFYQNPKYLCLSACVVLWQ